MNVTLTPEAARFVNELIDRGEFHGAAEVVASLASPARARRAPGRRLRVFGDTGGSAGAQSRKVYDSEARELARIRGGAS